MSKASDYYGQLATAMYKTRGARFQAAIRLRIREKCGNGIIAYLSLYLVALSVTSVTFSGRFTDADGRFIGVLTTVVSLGVVIFALLEYASGLGIRSERLHANALQISALMRQLEAELVRDPHRLWEMESLSEKYERAISETYVNHAEKDFKKFLLYKRQGKSIPEKLRLYFTRTIHTLLYWSSELWLHILVGFSAPVATLAYLFYRQVV
jgi:SMODS and SLOG-associating 2TM effector domain family 5